jgi:HNH endonuclease
VAKRKPSLRGRVWSRADECCEYCHLAQAYDPLPFHVEHVISKKHRGRTVLSNLALSCAVCNLCKASNIAGLDDLTGELTRLFNPRIDVWSEHFAWDGPLLVGTTAIGRTTVEVLGINQPERVRLRRFLLRMGVFPPRWDPTESA